MLAFKDSQQEVVGFLAIVPLHQLNESDRAADPAVRAAWEYLRDHAPLRSGEIATIFRFWMGRDTYQAVSPAQSLVVVKAVQHFLATPGLAHSFFPCADPTFWAMAFVYADLVRIPQADFQVGGRTYGVYGHDWRVVPPVAWLELLAEREIAFGRQTGPPQEGPEPLVVLSQPDFTAAVRDALRNFTRQDLLVGNPLLRSRAVVAKAGAAVPLAERAALLRELVTETAEMLNGSPREAPLYRALLHTYFQPAPTQEQAAELLSVPFSTFRRHLNAGIARLTERLWQREIGM